MAAGTLTVQEIFTRARELLGDKETGGVQWLDTELYQHINEGALEVLRHNPAAGAVTSEVSLVAGTLQKLPSGGLKVLRVNHNGTPAAPGRFCRTFPIAQMDALMPDWQLATPAALVSQVMPSEVDPMGFWVYPPNDGTGKLSVTYCAKPAPVTATTDLLPVADIYLAPLVDYVCYRAYLKQLESEESRSRAAEHKALFDAAMGLTKQGS